MQLLEKFDSVFEPTVNCSQSDSLVDDPLFHFEINHETKSERSIYLFTKEVRMTSYKSELCSH